MLIYVQGRWAPAPDFFPIWDAQEIPADAMPGSVSASRGWVEILALEPLPAAGNPHDVGAELIVGALVERWGLHPLGLPRVFEVDALTPAQRILVCHQGQIVPRGAGGVVELRVVTEKEVDLDTGGEMLTLPRDAATLAALMPTEGQVAVMPDRRWLRVFPRGV